MLVSGTKLGSYEVLAQIGAGGMGEVYKAHDAKLGRDVPQNIRLPRMKSQPYLKFISRRIGVGFILVNRFASMVLT